jgi:hypothetical protein
MTTGNAITRQYYVLAMGQITERLERVYIQAETGEKMIKK